MNITAPLKSIRSVLVNIGDSLYYRLLARELAGCKNVLDIGCGKNSPLHRVPKHFHSEGLDIHTSSITESKRKHIHDAYRIADIRKLGQLYKKKSFDAVVALDVLEHMDQKDGINLMEQMEAIARKKIIMLTPNGFIHQHEFDNNPYQVHKSGWNVVDLQTKGYQCYGLRGLKGIRGECGTIGLKPWFIWGILAVVTEYLTFYIPQAAAQIFAVKKIE